jgi:hypothetical protein
MMTPEIERAYFELVQRYRSRGILVGRSELLLTPETALNLVDELMSLGVVIAEVSPWYYGDPIHKQRITEFVGYDFDLTDEVIFGVNAAIRSADLAKQFIIHNLPENTALVSLMVVEPGRPTEKIFGAYPKSTNQV